MVSGINRHGQQDRPWSIDRDDNFFIEASVARMQRMGVTLDAGNLQGPLQGNRLTLSLVLEVERYQLRRQCFDWLALHLACRWWSVLDYGRGRIGARFGARFRSLSWCGLSNNDLRRRRLDDLLRRRVLRVATPRGT